MTQELKLKDIAVVGLDELQNDPNNARLHDGQNLAAIAASLQDHGQVEPLVVQKSTGIVIGGNGRLQAMRDMDWPSATVVYLDIDDATRTKLALRLNRTAELATWNDEVLSSLLDGIRGDDFDLSLLGWDNDDLVDLFDDIELEGVPGLGAGVDYSQRIKAPVYEPRLEEPPPVEDLFDLGKTTELLGKILDADLPPEVTDFLNHAAMRHTRFHFGRIAEYYAHAESDVQALMEQSALVIIDYNSAIEAGFVKLSKRLASLVAAERLARGEVDADAA